MIWKYVPNQSPDAIPIACCDLVNRGTAYHPSGKIFIQLLQGELLALDAKTGKELWKVKNADYKQGSHHDQRADRDQGPRHRRYLGR